MYGILRASGKETSTNHTRSSLLLVTVHLAVLGAAALLVPRPVQAVWVQEMSGSP